MKSKLLLAFLCLNLLLNLSVKAQGLTCASSLPVTPGTFTASTLLGTPSQASATAAGWYSFTPSSNGILNVSSCGGGSDTRLWIWSGTCSALVAVANNDDFAGCISTGVNEYASKIENVILMAGVTYYFEWDNVWEATGFTWSFTFAALPMNNDAGITYVTNRYTRIPISQASYGIPLGATVKNFSGAPLTNVVLTTEIYELPNVTTPIQTFASTPITMGIGAQQILTSATWAPNLTTSKSYLIKYIKTQNEVDGVLTNNQTTQNLILDFNYIARDNNTYTSAFNWSTTLEYTQGVLHSVLGSDNLTGVAYNIQSTSTTQVYNVVIFPVTNGTVGTTPLYTSANITANGAGWKYHTLPTALPVTAGEYLIAIKKSGTVAFPVSCDASLFTAGKNLIRTGAAGAWNPMEAYGVSFAFMIRPKFGNDPNNDVSFVNNSNPGGQNTKIHTRQSLSGNDLVFWARAKNLGTALVSGVTLTVKVTDAANALLYTATSAPQDLTSGQIDTFTVSNYTVTAIGTYNIEYIFNNTGDQIPQNNSSSTTFTRTTGEMSRTVGINGSLGLNATTVANNIVFGNNYSITQNDYLDSVLFVLNPGTPVGYVASVNIYPTTLGTGGAMVPTLTPIASTITYTTTAADNVNGVVIKLPIAGGTLNLTPGTYFMGVYQASSSIGNIRLASSTNYHSVGMSYYRWDQTNAGNWIPAELGSQFVSFVVNPIFKSCVPYNPAISTVSASCGSNDGCATVLATGGTGTVSYVWSNNATTSTVCGNSAGPIQVNLSDVNGCAQTVNVIIPSLSNLSVSGIAQNVTCGGESTGSITLAATQGILPYTYSWSNNLGSSASIANVPSGVYSCTIIDSTGCLVVFSDTLVELSNLNAVMDGTEVLCNAVQTGNLEVTVVSGIAPYSYQWQGTSNTSNYVTSVGAGTYTCTVTDGLGCTEMVMTNLEVSDLSAIATASNPLCEGTNTGSISVTVSGGDAPYNYVWSGTSNSTTILSGLSGGSYSCLITDANGCSTAASGVITEPSAWNVSVSVNPEIYGNDGSINLQVTGASGIYTFDWDNNATSEDLTNLNGGTYVVLITDSVGCTFTDSIVVNSLLGVNLDGLTQVLVYPNPSNGQVNLLGSGVQSVSLFNQLGQRINANIVQLTDNEWICDLGQLSNGSYFLEIVTLTEIQRSQVQLIH
jgi:hypothetical protein